MQSLSKTLCLAVVLSGLFLTGCLSPQIKLQNEGVELYTAKNYPQALEKFQAALKYNQFDASNDNYAGSSHLELGQFEQAEYHLRTAWQVDPGIPEVKTALTETLLRQGKPNLALDFLERDAEYTNKVQDPRDQKRIDKRRYVWDTEERMYLGKAGDRLRIAQTYEKLGNFDNARVYFEQARSMAPRAVRVTMAYALFFERIGDKPSAVELLKEVYRMDPATPGLVPAMTRNGVMISDLISVPKK